LNTSYVNFCQTQRYKITQGKNKYSPQKLQNLAEIYCFYGTIITTKKRMPLMRHPLVTVIVIVVVLPLGGVRGAVPVIALSAQSAFKKTVV
jgi:hypothetical protein